MRGPETAHWKQVLARLIASFAAGASFNLGFAPFGWWPLALAAPAALFALIRGLPPRRAGWTGASFGLGLFAFGTYWLYTCLHVFGLVPVWLTLMLQTLLVAAMSLYVAALCYLSNRFWLKPSATRDWLVLPALWVLLEWLRGWLLSGFPWLSTRLCNDRLALGGVGAAAGRVWRDLGRGFDIGGDQCCIHAGLAARRDVSWRSLRSRYCLRCPRCLSPCNGLHPSGSPVPIAAVQGAVPQDQKWQAKNRELTMQRYLKLTGEAWGARLIVWPEASLPVLSTQIPDYLHQLEEQGRAHGADFAIGLVDYRPATKQYFNGILVMSRAGDDWYYKRHLVPFGEYFPVPSFVRRWLRLMSLPYDDFTAGSSHQPTLSAAGQKLALSICYEDAFGSQQLRRAAASHLVGQRD